MQLLRLWKRAKLSYNKQSYLPVTQNERQMQTINISSERRNPADTRHKLERIKRAWHAASIKCSSLGSKKAANERAARIRGYRAESGGPDGLRCLYERWLRGLGSLGGLQGRRDATQSSGAPKARCRLGSAPCLARHVLWPNPARGSEPWPMMGRIISVEQRAPGEDGRASLGPSNT